MFGVAEGKERLRIATVDVGQSEAAVVARLAALLHAGHGSATEHAPMRGPGAPTL